MTAHTTTLPGLPAAFSRIANSCKVGLLRRAHNAGMYNARLILEFPTLDILERDLTDEPDSYSRGAIPQNTSSCLLLAKFSAPDNSPRNVTAVF
jgi:hypothetical protein